jgi:hypothetical protein
MKVNQDIVKLGELIHDALQDFVKNNLEVDHEIYSKTLEGGCAVASAFLVRAIRNQLRVKADFVAASGHAWVESGGLIYDPTAIQFDKYNANLEERSPKVKVLLKSDSDFYPYRHQETKRIRHINSYWPRGQRPSSFSIVWNNGVPFISWLGRQAKVRAA